MAKPREVDYFAKCLFEDDNICLTCVTPTSKDSQNVERVCLGAEGFGNRMCYLENLSSKHVPPDLSMCMFVLEQALSVRALQEMVTSTSQDMATQSGHRTLLYGHAVLLKHANSSMYLSCLSTSSSNDKLAFDVGLTETPQGESCWWTIHPASKQRSEGEKVRVGDDLILVSVASERYLHIGSGQSVIASFQQTLWTVAPVCSGAIRQKSLGFVFGGDVLRLFHGHMDECLTIPPAGSENEFSAVMYEVGAVCTHARSLWRLEHIRTKWAGGFMGWAHPCRFRHVTSGRYLGLTADNQVTMLHRDDASDETTAFFLRQSKDDRKHSEAREDEGMGTADIKYGDSIVFLQHCQTGLWLSYQTFETKKKGVGRVEEKKAVMLVEGHMDDGLSFVRAQEEESRSARVIRKCQSLFHRFIKALDALKTEGRSNPSWQRVNLSEVIKCLEDLIEYFAQPQENEEHEEKQLKLKALRNRQDLFQEEGMIALILSTIDNFSRFHSRRHFANYAGEEAANTYEDISGYLYLLLAAMIRGNRANCAQFADCNRLDWLVNRLESQQSSQGVLEVLHCVLIDSPEALNMIKEQHIRTIISLIDKHGRDPKVLNVLCSLCVGNGVAVRSNQNLICDNLLPTRDLLLQSQLVDHVSSMHPNVYVGLQEGSAMYKKWYFEIAVEYVETVTHLHPHIRVGWANTTGFCPFPAGGDRYGANGVGDDLYSYGFDGGSLWTAGKPKTVRLTSQYLVKGDIIGCALDLTIPKISFTVNGVRVKGFFKDFNLEGLFYPVVSLSAKVSCRFMLGGEHGRLKHGPPEDHAPISEALLPREKLKIQPSFHFGNIPKGVLCGPSEIQSYTFVPNPVDTSQIQLPTYIENVRDRLAENIHELWAMGKIEQGWISGEMRDDQRKIHPCLTTFERLPAAERKYDITLAYETLRTLLALGYHITIASPDQIPRLKTLKLPNNYLQSSGYKPTPLDLSGIVLDDRMHDLVELLAENTHNVWARDRIKQGWTYGLAEDSKNRRSPHLIPYAKVDEAIKRANRETASETVRTLIAYGYNLEPPTNEGGEGGLANEMTTKKQATRTYRGQLTYAVTSGKWYYEFEVITPGYMRVGWTKVSCKPDAEIGEDDKSYAFDGYMARKWHNGSEAYGKTWQAGDVIGCMLDIPDRTISFSLNGEAMMDPMGQEIAFKDIDVSEGYVPVFTLGQSQQAKLNFGQDVNSLKYFTCCGLQEGYEPFCVNMTKQMTLWYSQDNPIFMPVPKDHHRIGVSRMPGGSNTPPCLKVVSKNYGTLEKVQLEFIKLNLPIKCHDEFRPRDKHPYNMYASRIEAKMNFENLRRGQMDISEEQGLTNGYKDGESAHKVIADSSESDDRRQSKMSESASSGTELQRGYTEDYSIDAGERRKVFGGSRGGKPHSLDSSLGSPVSDMELEDSMLTVPTSKEKSSSKFSLLENFQDASRQISSLEKPTKRSKSPFSLFKKSRSRDPSPSERGDKKKDKKSRTLPSKVGRGDSMDDSLVTPSINIQEHRDDAGYPGLSLQKSFSEVSYGSDADSQSEVMDPDINVSEVFDYYYGVRVFPGQDPSHVWVGWVTSGYHFHQKEFQMKKVRNVVVCTLDADYHLKTSVSRKNCYMVSAGDLQQRYGQQEQTAGSRRVSPGLLIGSFIDASTGLLSFTVNGKEVANKFQVEPGTKLYPAVFCEPTNNEMFQFELGRTKTTLPLSAALFRGAKDLIPQCPSRLDVQLLVPHRWSSVPNKSLKVNTLKLSEIRGWSMLCESPVAMLGLHIPEEDRSLDILELIEHTEALKFHVHTLELYRAICSHGNHRAAYELTKHVDERQLMYCIQSEYLSGALRMGFHDLLISMHLESHAVTRLMTQNEFIIPLVADPKPLDQFVDKDKEKERQSIPKLERSVSIRPHLQLEGESNVGSMNLGVSEGVTPPAPMAAPPFYLGALKEHTMHSLVMAVKTGGPHIRDPIGGSQENLFVPLLRLIDRLLVMGMCTEEDLHQLFVLIDPHTFDKERIYTRRWGLGLQGFCAEGLLQMKLAEPVKLEMCHLLKHLCDCQLRKRMESIMSFATDFCAAVQNDQRVRYNYIKQSDLPPAIAAKKTREFRCTPQEQMRSLLNFKSEEDEDGGMVCPCSDDLKEILKNFHNELLEHCAVPSSKEEKETEVEAVEPPPASSWQDKILQLVAKKREEKKAETDEGKKQGEKPDEILGWSDSGYMPDGSLQNLISNTMRKWAEEDFITDQSLVQEMFSLLYRQYDGIGEVLRAILKTYVISAASTHDINNLVKALGNIRALLNVQVAPQEEETLKSSIKDLLDNKVFFQHPDLMRALYVHETVMQLMVNTLNKQQQQQAAGGGEVKRDGDVEQPVDNSTDMVVMCCRFLCYFCRTSRQNQRAMFDHLSYLLENSSMLLAHPSLRGSCPLDVAYSSMMDNNELALALRESHLEKVAVYLSRAGVQSNSELLVKGYPDIGWDPVEGERFLDFLRFCVWVNGESVEENSNLVVRLLIRRPECLGPALRGEGGGLLKAMKDGIRMSEQIAASRDSMSSGFLAAINDDNDTEFLRQSEEKNRHIFLTHDGVKYDFSTLPPEDDEDYIDMGGAILDFYSALVDLLGRCAPDAEIIKSGRSDSLRARAILRSLVSVEDLEGVLGLKFILPITSQSDDGEAKQSEGSLPPGLLPQHKSAVVQFLERVYGIPDQSTFFRLLEDGFLPDLRAATTLDTAAASDSDMALALNRYLCNSVLPLLTAYAHFFDDADHVSSLLDSTLHTTYRLSKCRSLTKNQKDLVTEFLVSLTGHLRPPMMTKLLRKLTIDLPGLNENTVVPLRVLTHHYERCGRYYGTGGWGSWGAATEEEKKLTMMLFTLIFDSLAQRAYDPELFSKALPCLSAIGCALSPDYSLSNQDEPWLKDASLDTDGMYNPQPVETTRISLSSPLESVARKFAEHYHDSWAVKKFDQSWVYGPAYDEDNKIHPNLKPFSMLNNKDSVRCLEPVRESMRAMLAWGWTLDVDQNRLTSGGSLKRRGSRVSVDSQNYNPRPVDLRNLTLTREMQNMAERLASNSHDVWARKKKDELDAIGGGIHQQVVPFDILTDKEKRPHRERAQELLKFLQMQGYRLQRQSKDSEADSGVGVSATEKRFAYSLLEKLLEYVDKAAVNLNTLKPSSRYSRRESYTMATEDVKFFGKVVLPLVEKYFRAHKVYFIAAPGMPQASVGMASVKEKEMTASLFCKLAFLLRQKITAFGHDVDIAVRCLQVLVHAIDARSVVKNSPEIVRSSLLPFFNNAADDLYQVVHNIKSGRFSHVKGTISRGATSLNYVHMVLLPVLSSMFDHLGSNNYGADLLVGEMQLASYKILNALYTLGTSTAACVERHRPLLGECIASFASTFPVAFLEPQLNRYNKHSMLYGITEERIAEHSLEAQDVMKQLADNLPTLDKIVAEIEELAESGGKYQEAPHVIEVTLPMLCSYLPFWWSQGPDNVNLTEGQDYGSDRRNSLQFDTSSSNHVTTVTAQLMNAVLGNVLKLIKNNVGTPNAPWMNRIATRTQPIIANSTLEMLEEHMLPLAEKITDNRHKVELLEEQYNAIKRNQQDIDSEIEEQLHDAMHILVRDIYAFFPLLIKYVDQHRSHWLRNPTVGAEKLYTCIAEIFTYWTKSPFFKREEHNFVTQNEIDNMALIMPSQQGKSLQVVRADSGNQSQDQESTVPKSGRKKHKPKMDSYTSLNVACLKRLLPIGLNLFGGREQELVQQAKDKLIQKEPEGDIEEFLKSSLMLEDENEENDNKWQKVLYKKIGRTKFAGVVEMTLDHAVERVMSMARVLHGLHLVEHPPPSHKGAWRKVISTQRKRAVMACFRMVPLHNLPRHRVINLFMKAYKEQWLIMEDIGQVRLIEDLTHSEEEDIEKKEEEEEEKPDALTQLVTALSRTATTEQDTLQENFLYMSFAQIMSKSCSGEDEDDDDENEEDPGASFQEQEMEKQQLLFEQSRLADRAAAEMMLLYISASRGAWTDMVINTIDLGISLLRGGNEEIQSRMLTHLREKKDVGFFTSIAGMMQRCSVLDLDAFERNNKAESLGVGSEGAAGVKNLHDAEQTCKLFRFLQLLCEGHNLEFQNYLRTQAGNNTTVNIIICTVDYLLRLQESIMDFYWHYSGKDVIDPAGKDNFVRAIKVAKQVFRTLTEYIQGPCSQNQLALAHSRLWDAVGGFLYIFAHMQDKLSKDPEQLELLREFMKLQKDMMIMLLSMLEGNVMNGPIGKQMVDTLVESSANVEMILKFFDIFLKMKDMTTSEAFLEFDTNKDGWISCKEFRRAMLDQKMYKSEEIDYIMMCVDTNQDGKVDFMEFTDRFHNPAKDIGFNVAVLLTNLSEHMPSEPRLARLMERAKPVLDYFGMYLGRIEILGSSGRIERVYFEIKQSHIDQWEKPQIKESKRSFLHSVVNEGGDKEKLESFVNFCEDTIFEMQHATSISAEEQMAQMATAAALRKEAGLPEEQGAVAINAVKTGFSMLKDGILLFLSFFSWANIKHGYQTVKGMTFSEMLLALMKLGAKAVLAIMTLMFHIVWMLGKWVIAMMMGDQGGDLPSKDVSHKALPYASPLALEGEKARPGPGKQLGREAEMAGEDPEQYRVFGLDIHREETDVGVEYSLSASQRHLAQTTPESSLDMSEGEMADHLQPKQNGIRAGEPAYGGTHGDQYDAFHQKKPPHDAPAGGEHASGEDVTDKRKQAKDDELPYEIKGTEYGNFVLGWFARNFYNFKFAALVLAFIINFVLLFYQVVKVPIAGEDVGNDMAEAAVNATEGEEGGEEPSEEEFEEWITMASTLYYLLPVVQLCALAHTIVSFSIAIAYYCLKVPLVIFKREKEIARKLEFEGMWIAEQPSEDDIKSHWDKLVLSTASFPESYWDKFVKKKVRNKYCEQFDFDEISNLLGMEKGSTIPGKDAHQEQPKSRFLPHFLQGVDWQYHIWKWGVIFTDNSFLYLLCFCLFSVLGNFNYFFFAAHLLDLAIGIKALSTILQSVTHNGKQLVLTVMLTIVVVYVYTVIAFNFFRQFYAKEEDGEKDYKCQDMLTCFIFHLYVGVRAGGGIGDEIEAPDGDPYEVYRILFDITFFFFVIVILLAIMQGLIIDAFGELRDQLEQVKEDMESKCFICGIGKEYFDKVPHGFEQHVMNEHNFANYMFFLMHLINKPDTEYTGQESYVWELYNQRCWDFFPVGDCFRKQYEDEPQGS